MRLMGPLVMMMAFALTACSERSYVVLSVLSSTQQIIQVEARGRTEQYSIYLLHRGSNGELISEQKLVNNIDMPGDVGDYVAFLAKGDDIVHIGVKDDDSIGVLEDTLSREIKMCRYSEAMYSALMKRIADNHNLLLNCPSV